jgi:hypothetical protein
MPDGLPMAADGGYLFGRGAGCGKYLAHGVCIAIGELIRQVRGGADFIVPSCLQLQGLATNLGAVGQPECGPGAGMTFGKINQYGIYAVKAGTGHQPNE